MRPPNQEHYAHVVCAVCKTTLCFRPHPHTLAKRQQNAAKIQKLVTGSRLTSFERGFLTGIRNHKPTPQQQQMLDALVQKYILNKGVNSSETNRKALAAAGR